MKKEKSKKKKKSVLKRIANIIFTVVLVLLTLLIILTIVTRVTGNNPTFFGYMIFRVSTGSMEPELAVGDVILTKTVDDVNSLEVGDVITYQGAYGDYEGKLITHKIVEAPYKGDDGLTYVVTKGVANPEPDPPVSSEQIVGRMQCKIPVLNWIYSFFLTPWGLLLTIALIVLAFAGEFWNIFKAAHQQNSLPEVDKETLEKAVARYRLENPEANKSDKASQPADDTDAEIPPEPDADTDDKLEFEPLADDSGGVAEDAPDTGSEASSQPEE